LAAEIQKEIGIPAVLHQSSGGVFEVDFQDDRIFSKSKVGRFPLDGEVLDVLRARYAANS
jgi:hypothetical protein